MIAMLRQGLILCVLLTGTYAIAQDAAPEIRVERQDPDAVRSLEFLQENQIFLRAQLDRLRTRTHWREHDARELSAHQQWLRGLGDDLAAATDSLDRERAIVAERTLLRRIEQLAEIEAQLDRFDALLAAQAGRLEAIESDYVGRQETALAVLATGLPVDDARAIVVHSLDGDPVRVDLDEASRTALRTGAIATLLHDFVEPRAHELSLAIEHADGRETSLGVVRVDATRDRLNFVQVALDRRGDDGLLETATWTR